MVTSTMTIDDLIKTYQQDACRIKALASHKLATLRRELRKGFKSTAYQCYDQSINGTPYKICLCISKKTAMSALSIYAYIKETNEYADISMMLHGTLVPFSYTSHFLHRYAERYIKRPDAPINAILANIDKNAVYFCSIYKDGENIVMANTTGLYLIKRDQKRMLDVCKTFVSLEMLKTSQIKAFELVGGLLQQYHDRYCDDIGRIHQYAAFDDFSNDMKKLGVTKDMIYSAYGEYFEKRKKHHKCK